MMKKHRIKGKSEVRDKWYMNSWTDRLKVKLLERKGMRQRNKQ